MDAIIGRYRVSLEDARLLLKHPAGISFDLTAEEILGLGDFINVYREALLELREEGERQTEPSMKAVKIRAIVPGEENNGP